MYRIPGLQSLLSGNLLITYYVIGNLLKQRVSWCVIMSNYFVAINGVKQGGVLSLLLFCLYVGGLFVALSKAEVGCSIGCNFVGDLAYADDIVLLHGAPSAFALRKMLVICDSYVNNKIYSSRRQQYINTQKRSATNITASTLCHVYGYIQLYDAIHFKLNWNESVKWVHIRSVKVNALQFCRLYLTERSYREFEPNFSKKPRNKTFSEFFMIFILCLTLRNLYV